MNMKFGNGEREVTPQLRAMLLKAGRADLADKGFEVDEATVGNSLPISHSWEQAIYHALFDKSAPHAATINPLPPPEPTSSNDEMLKWVVAKQAESAALQASTAQAQADQVSAAVSDSAANIATAVEKSCAQVLEFSERRASDTLERLGQLANMCAAHLDRLDGHVADSSALISDSISAARQIAGKQEAQALSMAVELNESISAVAVEINESAGMRSGQILTALETAADVARQRWEERGSSRVNRWDKEAEESAARDKSTLLWRRIYAALLLAILITLLAGRAHAQGTSPLIMGGKASGVKVANSQRLSGPYYIDCGASTTFSVSTSTLTCPGSGGSSIVLTRYLVLPLGGYNNAAGQSGGGLGTSGTGITINSAWSSFQLAPAFSNTGTGASTPRVQWAYPVPPDMDTTASVTATTWSYDGAFAGPANIKWDVSLQCLASGVVNVTAPYTNTATTGAVSQPNGRTFVATTGAISMSGCSAGTLMLISLARDNNASGNLAANILLTNFFLTYSAH